MIPFLLLAACDVTTLSNSWGKADVYSNCSFGNAVLVSPAHQFPTGVVLSPERRARLLEWAERTDALVAEDDYDAEFRYDRAPVGALQGLAPERVAYLGSASKTLAPALRLGWLVAPSGLVRDLIDQLMFTIIAPPSKRAIVPVTIVPTRSLYSS